MRAPVSRSRPPCGWLRLFAGLAACQSRTMRCVGGLGLLGELALGVAHPLRGWPTRRCGLPFSVGAPAVISSSRSFLAVSEGCWWA